MGLPLTKRVEAPARRLDQLRGQVLAHLLARAIGPCVLRPRRCELELRELLMACIFFGKCAPAKGTQKMVTRLFRAGREQEATAPAAFTP